MRMSDPDFWNSPDTAKAVSQEATKLKEEVQGHDDLINEAADLSELYDLAAEDEDTSFTGEIERQYYRLVKELEKREVLLLLSGEYDSCNAIMAFHAGAGGTEAQDWTQMIVRMYSRWAEQHGYTIRMIDYQPGDEAGTKSCAFTVEGENAYGYLKSEKGVHRLVRISPFDTNGRRHTSFTAVDVMPELPDDAEVEINMDDVRVDYFRASGAGGQHVNKTSSAVRMTHIPTGIVVQCQNERSQIQNREMCMKYLRAKLFELEEEKKEKLRAELTGTQQSIEWGSQIRSYVFHPYNLVKDHRTGVETSNIQSVMDGNIDMFIEGRDIMRKLIVFLVIVAGLCTALQLKGQEAAEEGLYRSLNGRMNVTRQDVIVKVDPGMKMLLGRLDSVYVHSGSFAMGKLKFESFDCSLSGIRFNPLDSLAGQRLYIGSAETGSVQAVISSSDLQSYLQSRTDKISDAVVTFEDNSVHIRGKVRLGNLFTATTDITGNFVIDGTRLKFLPSHIGIEGAGKSYGTDNIGAVDIFDFDNFPFGIVPQKVETKNNLLIIHGQVR